MPFSVTRRTALAASVAATFALAVRRARAANDDDPVARIAAVEKKHGGRLCVAALDLATGMRIEHRANERVAMCSTFKFLAAAQVLARVDRGDERLDRRVRVQKRDLMPWSPVTEKRIGATMSVAALCEAAMTASDNTAANLLLASVGGPAAFTTYVRSLGDPVTRLDRIEPEMNEAAPGDPRDTTTPSAMLGNLRTIVLGDALSPASRQQITAWLVANKTGDDRLRAGLPMDWRVGDKTGASQNGVTNDIAVAWPPAGAPVLISVYFAESTAPWRQRRAAVAAVGRIVAEGVTARRG